MENRIIDLEIRNSHQEAAIDELTRKVVEHERSIQALRQELEYIKSLIRELAPSAVAPASEETPPPHY